MFKLWIIDTADKTHKYSDLFGQFAISFYASIDNAIRIKKMMGSHFPDAILLSELSRVDLIKEDAKDEGRLEGFCNQNNSYTNAVLVHFHTRSLEDIFVKALTSNLGPKRINPNILVQKYSTNELKSKMVKLKLYCHS